MVQPLYSRARMTDNTTPSGFASLGLSEGLVKTLAALGYEAPTPIQEKTIPVLLAGKDVIGQAQTGTGKTAAFSLPMLQQINPSNRFTQALVLAPTRELAMQVSEAIHSYARGVGQVNVLPVYGGAPIGLQMKHLERGVHVVVGTPGRLIDHLDRKTLDLSKVRVIVLDEADEMLKMGFIEEVERILSELPKERQIALFSATMPDEVLRISKRYLRNPTRIEIEHKTMTAPAIEQRFLNVSEGQKLEVLTQILELQPSEATLVFRRTKNGAAELAEKLQARGFAAEAMHGDMTQSLREAVIRRLRNGNVEVVTATDVAARGLDVEQITHVINYDIPHDVEVYVHRIGRTGRAGRSGVATIFITPRERRMLREIERYTGMSIKPMKMPTRADVAAKRSSVFKEALRKNIEQGDLDLYVALVEQLAEEGPFDMAEVAAAAARIASSNRSLAAVKEETPVESRPPAGSANYPEGDEGRRRVAGAPPESHDRDEKKVRLSMGVGKRDGIRPADVVGSIANEADIPGRDIGPIEIREQITFVTIPLRYRDQALAAVKHAKFRGRPVNLQVADDQSGPPPRSFRPSFAPRPRGAADTRRPAGRPTGRPTGPRRDAGPRRERDSRPPRNTSDRRGPKRPR